MGKIKEAAKKKAKDGVRWGIRRHPVARKAHDMHRERKEKKNRARGRKVRRRERPR